MLLRGDSEHRIGTVHSGIVYDMLGFVKREDKKYKEKYRKEKHYEYRAVRLRDKAQKRRFKEEAESVV